MASMMEAVGARTGQVRHQDQERRSIEALKGEPQSDGVEFVMLGDFYPSGDEYELVYTATGRLIPPAGIPLQVGCVVNNVETLYNVAPGGAGHSGHARSFFRCAARCASRNRSGRRWGCRFAI